MNEKTNLDKFFENAESLDEQRYGISLGQSINPSFLARCSKFSSIEEMFEASGFKIETTEDFKAIPDNEWEIFITENTIYSSWEEMQIAALSEQAAVLATAHLTKGFKR